MVFGLPRGGRRRGEIVFGLPRGGRRRGGIVFGLPRGGRRRGGILRDSVNLRGSPKKHFSVFSVPPCEMSASAFSVLSDNRLAHRVIVSNPVDRHDSVAEAIGRTIAAGDYQRRRSRTAPRVRSRALSEMRVGTCIRQPLVLRSSQHTRAAVPVMWNRLAHVLDARPVPGMRTSMAMDVVPLVRSGLTA